MSDQQHIQHIRLALIRAVGAQKPLYLFRWIAIEAHSPLKMGLF
jgi:hypothetical protein